MSIAAPGSDNIRLCPFCSAGMPDVEAPCGSCGRFSAPATEDRSSSEISNSPVDFLNSALAALEHSTIDQRPVRTTPESRKSKLRLSRLLLGAALSCLGLFLLAMWTSKPAGFGSFPREGFDIGRDGLASLIYGVALLLGGRILRDGPATLPHRREDADHRTSLHFLGYDTNLILAQSILLGAVVVFASRYLITEATYAGLGIIAISCLLWKTPRFGLSVALGLPPALYLCFVHLTASFESSLEAGQYRLMEPRLFFPVRAMLALLAGLAIFPQLQRLQYRGFGPGRLKGDFAIPIGGVPVLIGVTTAAILANAALVLDGISAFIAWVSF